MTKYVARNIIFDPLLALLMNYNSVGNSLELIKIVAHPKSQTVKLMKAQETVTLQCQAESLSDQQLEYKWYYLRGSDDPATLKKENKNVKSREPTITIPLKLSGKQERRYFCEVSIANQPECCVASSVAVIKLESGELL